MKHNLNQATFIIPVRIESPDRLRNVVTSIAFLLENFHTNIIVKEVDKESIFHRDALPLLESVLISRISSLTLTLCFSRVMILSFIVRGF